MYLAHYQLKHKPFEISSDPRFLWLGEKHKEALAVLQYGVKENAGMLLLTGDVGTGKTTLINCLLQRLGPDVLTATVFDPNLDVMDFLNLIAYEIGMGRQFDTKSSFILYFRNYLKKINQNGRKPLLIIDEAQRLSKEILEEIRILSNYEENGKKLLAIFLVGQIELNQLLEKPENQALRQRITVNYNIEPMNVEETRQYIQHRLRVAGSKIMLFSPAAVREIYEFSRGYPRLINVICDRALLTGFVRGIKTIDTAVIRECRHELSLAGAGGNDTDSRPIWSAGKGSKKLLLTFRILLACAMIGIFAYIVWFFIILPGTW